MENERLPETVTRSAMKVLSKVGLDRPNLGLDKAIVRVLLLLCGFAFLLDFKPPAPDHMQYLTSYRSEKQEMLQVAVPAPAPSGLVNYTGTVAVNCASPDNYTSSDGIVFMPDSGFYGDSKTANWGPYTKIEGAEDVYLFQKERYGNFNYTFTNLLNGLYEVRIYETEVWWKNPGERLFNISIQDRPTFEFVDLVALANGTKKAYIMNATAAVEHHTLSIRFAGVKDWARVSAVYAHLLAPSSFQEPETPVMQFINKIAPPKNVGSRDFTISIFTAIVFSLLAAPFAEAITYRGVIITGAVAAVFTQVIVMYGTSLFTTALVQISFGLYYMGGLVFIAFLYLLVSERNFQLITSVVIAASLVGMTFGAAFSGWLTGGGVPDLVILFLSLIPVGIASVLSCMLPKDPEQGHQAQRISLVRCSDEEGPLPALKDTFATRNLRLLSFWWVFGGGIGLLMMAHAAELFESLSGDHHTVVYVLGHIMGALGAVTAIKMESVASRTGGLFYILGSFMIGLCGIAMGRSESAGALYILHLIASFTHWFLVALITAQSALLLRNNRYVLMLAANNSGMLVVQAFCQVFTAQSKMPASTKFIMLGALSLVVAAVFSILYWQYRKDTGRTPIVALPNQDAGYSLVNEDQPQKFGTDADWDDVWLQEGGVEEGGVELGGADRRNNASRDRLSDA